MLGGESSSSGPIRVGCQPRFAGTLASTTSNYPSTFQRSRPRPAEFKAAEFVHIRREENAKPTRSLGPRLPRSEQSRGMREIPERSER
ncbi:hypothetical protein Nepgr_010859 [Nepenthes gracilis]|uniref:Uncharacterized protein n=1 Tax=Nepenthes gracilis TaxID=150966 RepID=A0AAD3SE70_NEPGR|nr:hypothetical protein Nepgr_010859 [Nepenthes gracilis]